MVSSLTYLVSGLACTAQSASLVLSLSVPAQSCYHADLVILLSLSHCFLQSYSAFALHRIVLLTPTVPVVPQFHSPTLFFSPIVCDYPHPTHISLAASIQAALHCLLFHDSLVYKNFLPGSLVSAKENHRDFGALIFFKWEVFTIIGFHGPMNL